MPNTANTEVAAIWDGELGAYWATQWQRIDRSLHPYHERLFDAAAVIAEDSVLDVGCGNGQVTRNAARLADRGSALGLDLSAPMLARARAQAAVEGLSNVRFEQSDVQIHAFTPSTFDVVLSRLGAMFFGNPLAAFANIGSAMRPGGRLAMIAWQPIHLNEWVSEPRGAISAFTDLPAFPAVGSPGPFGLADADTTRAILTGSGFDQVDIESLELPMWVGSSTSEILEDYLSGPAVRQLVGRLDVDTRARVRDALGRIYEEHATPDGVVFGSAGWLIRARWPVRSD